MIKRKSIELNFKLVKQLFSNAEFAQKFFFPANWDVYVTFEPTENYAANTFTSESGKFELKTGY